MKREGDLVSLTDGRLYRSSDMAKLGCNDCEGCSACCKGMGNSVVLDPYDAWRLAKGLRVPFASLIGAKVMLSVVDGLILPSLNMETESGNCPFLNQEGRCNIHAIRPGICRLFPLGRYYHENGFSYVLMTGECRKENRTKVKIEKWLGEENLPAYEAFVIKWRKLLQEKRALLAEAARSYTGEQGLVVQKKISMELLQEYYFKEYGENFFENF